MTTYPEEYPSDEAEEFAAGFDAEEWLDRLAQEIAAAGPENWDAETEAAYKSMYGGSPETIRPNRGRARGEGRWAGGSLVWDAVDWTM